MNTDKHRLKSIIFFLCVLCILNGLFSNATAQTQPKTSSRILLIPLDDRPPCLQFPVEMGLIGDAEIVTPPRELLGRFTEAGKSDEIINWMKRQNLKSFDAAIVSIDMLAYGGLVAMRVHQTEDATAMRRIEFVREMRRLAPKMKIYGSSVIMRLAPTGDVKNEAYREKLAKWAEISVESDTQSKTDAAKLEKEIPAFALADYKAARVRDLKINLKTIDLVRDGTIDYLILSQDDAKPRGVHVSDREKLISETSRLTLTQKIAVQPGADEVSMLLLARALTDKYNYHPRIKASYSSEATKNQFMPYEDRALNQTVSFHIKSVGGIEAQAEKDGDLMFYVFASRFEPNRADSFADEIAKAIVQDNKIIVADIDPKGDVQGAQDVFVKELLRFRIFSFISGFAGWNTAGNTIGTTLPQAVIANIKFPQKNKSRDERTQKSQWWFLMHRLVDDYAYHSIVRPKALKMIRENKWNAFRLTDEQTKTVEEFCLTELKPLAAKIASDFSSNDKNVCAINELTFDLPWNRTFEAEINFKLQCPQ
jgi:hypothetical protein